MNIMNINHLQGQNNGNKGRKAQDYTDEVEDKAIKASHALELQNISVKARISRQPIIGTKTDNNRYMPIIGHLCYSIVPGLRAWIIHNDKSR